MQSATARTQVPRATQSEDNARARVVSAVDAATSAITATGQQQGVAAPVSCLES